MLEAFVKATIVDLEAPTAHITTMTHGRTIPIPRLGPNFSALGIFPSQGRVTQPRLSTM